MNLEAELLKATGKEELEAAVQEKIGEFHGFLTREAALKLLAAEKGLLKEETKRIADIKAGAKNISITGIVASVSPLARYESGNCSRKIMVDDGSGAAELMLWKEDAEEAAGIKAGDEVEVGNAYEKNGGLRLGYSGFFRITKHAGFTPLSEIAAANGRRVHVKSFISKITGMENGGFVFAVSDGSTEVECIMAAGDQRSAGLEEKREIAIENGLVEKGRILIDGKTRLLLKKEKVITGKVEGMKEAGDGIEVVISGKTVALNREKTYTFLGVKPVDGVELSTIINLKKDTLMNQKVVTDLGDSNGNNAKGSRSISE